MSTLKVGGDVLDLDVSRRIVYRVAGMLAANVQRGITYKRAVHQQLLMDVYRPYGTTTSSRWPAILFIPGGPVPLETLPPREWGVFQSYGELAAASECVGVVLNHRLDGLTDYEQAQADVTAAITHVRDRGLPPLSTCTADSSSESPRLKSSAEPAKGYSDAEVFAMGSSR